MIPYAQLQAIVSAVMGFAGRSSIALRDSSNFSRGSAPDPGSAPAAAFSVSGSPTYRPNLLDDPLTPEDQRTISNCLNPATVEIPTDRSQPFGNAPRNVARGPGFAQFDLGLHKAIGLGGENTRLELRFEAFNLFNRSNFSTPNANRSNANYGTSTSTSAARQIQLGVKVHF